jgi:hypothetical protein
MASERRPREAGSTPARGEVVRRRVDDEDEENSSDADSHMSSVSESIEDKDKAWHETTGKLPYVPIGSSFELGGVSFERDDNRKAKCMLCKREFGVSAYHLRGLNAHAVSCSAKEQRRVQREEGAAAAADWSGQISYMHTFEDGTDVEVTFERIWETSEKGREKGLKCNSCEAKLRQTAEFYQRQHVKGKHTPPSAKVATEAAKGEKKKAEKRTAAIGAGGAFAADDFFSKAKAAGRAKEEVSKKRQEDVDNARTRGEPLPPLPPLLLHPSTSVITSRPRVFDSLAAQATTQPPLVMKRSETNFDLDLESFLRKQYAEVVRLNALVADLQGDDPLEEDGVVFEEGGAPAVCRGIQVDLPEPTLANYPFAIDEVIYRTWTTPTDESRVRSKFCRVVVVDSPRGTTLL